MGDLYWRKRGGVLGCWRGWVRIAGLAAFALVGYFALYAWLRANDEIRLYAVYEWSRKAQHEDELLGYAAWVRNNPTNLPGGRFYYLHKKWPRESMTMTMTTMWPAIKLEAALARREWLPYGLHKTSDVFNTWNTQ